MKEHPGSGLVQTIIQFVKWIDSWKKMLFVVLFAIIIPGAVIVWEYRAVFIDAFIKEDKKPNIAYLKLDVEMKSVMHDTNALAVVVWSVSMERNYREAIYVRINDRKMNNLEGMGDTVLRLDARETTEIIRLLDTSASCWPYEGKTTLGLVAVTAGVKWVCATTIPPSYGIVAGILATGFNRKPVNEDFVKVRLINAAERILE